jgi:polyisoprenoid-binding protein YceI
MTELGPRDGTLTVRTARAGAAARAGHDLVLEVTRWRATLSPEAMELTADADAFRVASGSGGVTPLSEGDRDTIVARIEKEILKGTRIHFRSTTVTPRAGGFDVEGELELRRARRPLRFAVDLDEEDGRVHASTELTQSDFGIKPYAALLGALKVADTVQITLDARLRDA